MNNFNVASSTSAVDVGEKSPMYNVEDPGCKKEKEEHREEWGNKTEEFLSALGCVIGLGNIWRFPYITYQNGGGAFLIPYLIFVLLCGFPMFFLETSLGQFTRKGAMEAWRIAPIMKGVGLGSGVITFFSSMYYITVMAWAVLYFSQCFTLGDLPWTTCDNWYNNKSRCITFEDALARNLSDKVTGASSNISLPIVEFWNNFVLRKSDGLHEMGGLENWPMVLCMLVSWIAVYFCIFRGTQSTGKAIYFTSLFPFITLGVLLVRGCTLDGASEGIKFYLKPNMSMLAQPAVWVSAGSQVCYSYCICFAVLIAYGSYSKYDSDCYKRTIYLSVSCSLTSFIGGFAVFAVLGSMAKAMGVEVDKVVQSGPGLAFLTYPTALSMMPLPQIWNACFFVMLITLAIDSQFCCLEGGLCLIYDQFEWPNKNREKFVGIICTCLFLCGLVFVTPGGIYVFELFNNYAVSGIALLWLVTWQSIGVGWVFGSDRYYKAIKDMIGYYPNGYIGLCYRYATPLLTSGVLLFYLINYQPLKVHDYVFPAWANGFGWILCMCSFLCVPGVALYEVLKREGNLIERFQDACQSTMAVPGDGKFITQRQQIEMISFTTNNLQEDKLRLKMAMET